ncbi:MAG: hypothetical protein A3F42_00145 [Gammaproteobacteria bacterium RIFCSPHIGHO2_12_FULL_37_34]|nr:MAG: hypothetical protein A3F42_00145 [Gammaproteobacteria bacterium RIFCSPHIGHO2_12_FULL_37_34]
MQKMLSNSRRVCNAHETIIAKKKKKFVTGPLVIVVPKIHTQPLLQCHYGEVIFQIVIAHSQGKCWNFFLK